MLIAIILVIRAYQALLREILGITLDIIKAKKEHSPDLAYLINLAGEGLPEYLWSQIAEDNVSAMELGAQRAARETGGFSYRNASVCTIDNELVGMVLAYRQDDPYEIGDITEYPDVVRPLVELEAQAPGSWYINAIATYEIYRRQGVGKSLMAHTEREASIACCSSLSLIVASENSYARQLYEALGFEVVDSRPVKLYLGCAHGGDWLLMMKILKRPSE